MHTVIQYYAYLVCVVENVAFQHILNITVFKAFMVEKSFIGNLLVGCLLPIITIVQVV